VANLTLRITWARSQKGLSCLSQCTTNRNLHVHKYVYRCTDTWSRFIGPSIRSGAWPNDI